MEKGGLEARKYRQKGVTIPLSVFPPASYMAGEAISLNCLNHSYGLWFDKTMVSEIECYDFWFISSWIDKINSGNILVKCVGYALALGWCRVYYSWSSTTLLSSTRAGVGC